MRTELDGLLKQRNLDALLVLGPGQHNPAMVYLTGGAHLTSAVLIKRVGADPVLFIHPMERDEAARTGLETRDLNEVPYRELLRQSNGDEVQAEARRYQRILTEVGLSGGRLALYGRSEVGSTYAAFQTLQASMPDLEVVGEMADSVLWQAMATKDEREVARIRRMGRITTKVVGLVADFLTSHRARDGVLIQTDGQPLTVGEVKRRINLWLTLEGAENPQGTIFAIGRDAGVPHSSGNPDDVLQLGQTIVFDIYPCEAGGGYYFDFTRTWCLGYAPDDAQALHADVLAVYHQIFAELKPNTACREYQRRACELFEAAGHPTVNSDPHTRQGYVHSLGHGLGLQVHERPRFGESATDEDRLIPGVVVTIEPGLYYPERGLGVRLENTVWMRPDGSLEVLADYPMDLVLPVQSIGE